MKEKIDDKDELHDGEDLINASTSSQYDKCEINSFFLQFTEIGFEEFIDENFDVWFTGEDL